MRVVGPPLISRSPSALPEAGFVLGGRGYVGTVFQGPGLGPDCWVKRHSVDTRE